MKKIDQATIRYQNIRYTNYQLPTNHLVDGLVAIGSQSVGLGMDGWGSYVSNILMQDCAGSGDLWYTYGKAFTYISVIDTKTLTLTNCLQKVVALLMV